MAFYMHFIQTGLKRTSLAMLEQGLKQIDAAFRIEEPSRNFVLGIRCGDLYHGESHYAGIQITPLPISALHTVSFLAEVRHCSKDGEKRRIIATLLRTTAIVEVVPLMDCPSPLELNPLFGWLFTNRKGLLRADNTGYFSGLDWDNDCLLDLD